MGVRKIFKTIDDWMEDDIFILEFLKFSLVFIFVIFAPLLVLGMAAYYFDSSQPQFSLKKSEWSCTASHDELHTTYVLAGKVMIPVTSTETVCDQFTRK